MVGCLCASIIHSLYSEESCAHHASAHNTVHNVWWRRWWLTLCSCCQASLQLACQRHLIVSLCADLAGARASAKSKAAKKNAARKAKKAVEGNPASVESVTNGLAGTRYTPLSILRYGLLINTIAAVHQHCA